MTDTVKLLIEIPVDTYTSVCNESMLPPDVSNVVKAIKHAQPLYNNATNGNAFMTLFPDTEVTEKNNGYEVYVGVGTAIQFFNHQWWNAKYR